MKHSDQVFEVAKWEFNRFYKFWDELKGFFIGLILFGGGALVGYWVFSSSEEDRSFHITENIWFEADSLQTPLQTWTLVPLSDTAKSRELVNSGDISGLVIVRSLDEVEFVVRQSQGWQESVREQFAEIRKVEKIASANLTVAEYDDIREGLAWRQVATQSDRESTRTATIIAIFPIGLMLMAVFLGFAYQFTAITGEKDSRTTEMMMSVISPQVWIDGKILGISGIGIVKVLMYGLMSLIAAAGLGFFLGSGDPFSFLSYIRLFDVAVFLVLALLGILMWNAFLAAIAATIDDPNTSQRSGMMMLPLVPVLLSAFALINPDSAALKVLGVFPLTSSTILPVRMVLTDVSVAEILVSILLLVATVWFFRRIAGKIFSYSILIYGKEPNLKEMIRWFKNA